MANYKNNRKSELGDKVVGVDGKGNPVSGTLVLLHSLAGRGIENHPDIAVVMSGKLIGDLFAKDFLHADDAKANVKTGQPSMASGDSVKK